jgi:signal transduction histidine kinase
VERALRITALVWSALWVGLDVAPALLDRDRFTNVGPAALALVLTLSAWVLVARGRRHAPLIFAVSLIVFGTILALTCRPGDLGVGLPAGLPAMYLAGITLGLMSSPRIALFLALVAGVVIGAALATRAIELGVWDASRETILTGPVIALCDTLGVAAVRRALISSATAADVSASDVAHARELAEAQIAAEAERCRLTRTLHDGVINTLAAIASGAGASHGEAIRVRCADDAAVLAQLRFSSEPSPMPSTIPHPPGLVVEYDSTDTEVPLAVLDTVPAAVRAALLGACREALMNVAKHSGTDVAYLSVSGTADAVRIQVRDGGVGFDPRSVSRGVGIAESIVARCEEVGATARVASSPGAGTVVEIAWRRVREERHPWSVERSEHLLRAAVLPLVRWVSIALLVEVSLITAITVHSLAGLRSVVAVIVLVALTFGAQRAVRRDQELPVGWAVAMLAAIPLLLWLPGSWLTGGARVGPAWWGTIAALIPLVHLVFLSWQRWMAWAWLVVYALSASTFVLAGWPGASSRDVFLAFTVCLGEGALGAVMLLLRRSVRRNTERADQAFAAEAKVRAKAAEIAGRDAARARHRGAALESTGALLTRIAEGTLDPAEERVRHECAREESYLRELITMPVGLERLAPRLEKLLLKAHHRQVDLSVRASEADGGPDEETTHTLLSVVSMAVGASQPGDSVVFGLFGTGGLGRATVVASATTADDIRALLSETTSAGHRARDVTLERVGDQVIVELTWRTP